MPTARLRKREAPDSQVLEGKLLWFVGTGRFGLVARLKRRHGYLFRDDSRSPGVASEESPPSQQGFVGFSGAVTKGSGDSLTAAIVASFFFQVSVEKMLGVEKERNVRSRSGLLFTSYERDAESGNDYAQARYYVNRLGRFSSLDLVSGTAFVKQNSQK